MCSIVNTGRALSSPTFSFLSSRSIPMLLLAIRLEIEVIFKNQYPKFFSEELHEKIAMKLINDLITQLFDPNLFFSRFSFLESNREAINIKYQKSKQQNTSSSQSKFFKRSALVEQLFPSPSEGKVRALFGTGRQAITAKTTMQMLDQKAKKEKKETERALECQPTITGGYAEMNETGFASLQDLRQGLKTAGINNPRKPEFST